MQYRHNSCQILVPSAGGKNKHPYPFVAGSGIVGLKGEDYGLVYYEGNLNNASNLNTIDERIIVAAGRLMTKYPTVAFTSHLADDMDSLYEVVGEVTLTNGKLTLNVTDRNKLDQWFSAAVQKNAVEEPAFDEQPYEAPDMARR